MIFDRLFASRSTSDFSPRFFSSMAQMFRLPVAGVRVDEREALKYAAVWACIRIISESIAVMPWETMRQVGEMRERQTAHGVYRLLRRRPNSEMTAFVFKRTLVSHAVSWGNGYAEIERNNMGEPIALWPITPDRVTPDRDTLGKLVYRVRNPDGSEIIIPASDMFHLPGLGFDGIQGYSVIHMARESISLGMATEQFGAAFFGNGAQPGLVITQKEGTKSLTKEAVDNLIATFTKKNQGAARAGKVNYLDAGMSVTPVGIPQKDAQFLETRKFQILEICRWYRVPPHKLAELDRATFSNVEDQGLDFVIDTLLPWVTGMEEEADAKLFKVSEGDYYTKLNMNVYMRGDSQARKEYYTAMFDRGVFSIDDILAMEERNPLPNGIGKLRMVPMNFVSVETAFANGGSGKGAERTPQQTKALWLDVAHRMVTKEMKAMERIADKEDAKAEAQRFYESHHKHIAEAFAAVAEFDGIALLSSNAQTYCRKSLTTAQHDIDRGVMGKFLRELRADGATNLLKEMGCPHV